MSPLIEGLYSHHVKGIDPKDVVWLQDRNPGNRLKVTLLVCMRRIFNRGNVISYSLHLNLSKLETVLPVSWVNMCNSYLSNNSHRHREKQRVMQERSNHCTSPDVLVKVLHVFHFVCERRTSNWWCLSIKYWQEQLVTLVSNLSQNS